MPRACSAHLASRRLSTKLTGADGPVPLIDIFAGRSQLIVYFQMWHTGGPAAEQCEGCTFSTTHINGRRRTDGDTGSGHLRCRILTLVGPICSHLKIHFTYLNLEMTTFFMI